MQNRLVEVCLTFLENCAFRRYCEEEAIVPKRSIEVTRLSTGQEHLSQCIIRSPSQRLALPLQASMHRFFLDLFQYVPASSIALQFVAHAQGTLESQTQQAQVFNE